MEALDEILSQAVAGVSCDHCRVAIGGHLTVRGHPLDDVAIRAAVSDAGYEAQ